MLLVKRKGCRCNTCFQAICQIKFNKIILTGYKGLSHFKYQEGRLKELLGRNNNMNIRIDVDASSKHPEQNTKQN